MQKSHLTPKILLQGFHLPFSSACQPHQGHLHGARCSQTDCRHLTGRKAPDGKGNNRTSGAFSLCPELSVALLLHLEQVQGPRLQAKAEQIIYWRGAATAAAMGTEAGVSYVTSPVLGQVARVSLECPQQRGEGDLPKTSTHSMGCNRAPAQSHWLLQQSPPQPPSTELGKIQGTALGFQCL